MDLSGALSWLKLSPKYLMAVAIATGLILFAPQTIISSIGMEEIRALYRPWLGVALLLSVSILSVNLFTCIYDTVRKKIIWKKNLSKLKKYLGRLTPEEVEILRQYIGGRTKTQKLPIESGVIQGLVNNKILYRSANIGDLLDGWAFNIQPWAWDYLNENLHLLFEPEEIMEVIESDL